MPDTATARIADFTHAAGIDHADDWLITIWRGRPLYLGDIAGTLAALADACGDHEACAVCGAAHCVTCGLGDGLTDCDPGHCPTPDCRELCGECGDAARDDQAVEVAEELALTECELP